MVVVAFEAAMQSQVPQAQEVQVTDDKQGNHAVSVKAMPGVRSRIKEFQVGYSLVEVVQSP